MLIAHQLELDQVCYNALRASEVAYCLSAVQAQILLLKVITQKINYLHRSYDDLQYPLLFPHEEDGYSIDIPKVDPLSKNYLKTRENAIVDGLDCYIPVTYLMGVREGSSTNL